MSTAAQPRAPHRQHVLEMLARVGRDHSDATVLFHSTMAEMLDLHPTDYKVLGMLDRYGPMSAGDIALKSGLAPASVTNLIDRLERKRFVSRMQDRQDGRRILVQPSPHRVNSARTLFDSTRRSLAELFDLYTVRDLEVIADFLGRNAERLRLETEKLSSAVKPKREIR